MSETTRAEFIRDKRNGQLHKVRMVDRKGYHTTRVSDGTATILKPWDVVRVKRLSRYPGDTEIISLV